MIFNLHDAWQIIVIAVMIFITSFALYLPILGLSKNNPGIVKYTVPLSWSFEIIIGYIFFTFGKISLFPMFYLGIILALNIWFIFVKKTYKNTPPEMQLFQAKKVFFFFLLLIPLFYSFFYDPVHNISPVQRDTFGHITFLRNLAATGRMGLAFYAPGFHILLFPIFKIVDTVDLYRFTMPLVGIIEVLSICWLFKDQFKHSATKYLLLLLFVAPIYNQLTIQIIGFFPSALTFLFFASFFRLFLEKSYSRSNLVIFSTLILALTLTVPYFLVQFVPAIFLGWLLLCFSKSKLHDKKFTSYYFKLLVISCCMFIVAFGHVYVQTKIDKYNAFPKIPIAEGGIVENNYILVQPDKNAFIENNAFLSRYITPLITTGLDVMRVKNIRIPNNALSIGGYVWLMIAIALTIFALKKDNKIFFVLSTLTIVYGVSVQTGTLELSFYRGRSGWYLMLLSILGIAFLFDHFHQKKYKILLYIATPLIIISCFMFPPKYYRLYYPEIFNQVYKIYKHNEIQKNVFYTDVLNGTQEKFSLINTNIPTLSLDDFLQNKSSPESQNTYIILEKKIIELDPVLSAGAVSTDNNFSEYNQNEQRIKDLRIKKIAEVRNTAKFRNEYKIFWQNDDIEIYQNINN